MKTLIKLKCDEIGISLAELHRQTGISYTYIHGLAAGTRNPTVEILQRIAAAIKCDWRDLAED